MINTLEELLEYYARYSCMEKVIDSKTSEKLQKGVKDYIKNIRALNLLNHKLYKMNKAEEILDKHLELRSWTYIVPKHGNLYNTLLDAVNEALNIPVVGNTLPDNDCLIHTN